MTAPCIRLPDEPLLEPIAIAQAIVDAYFPLHELSYGIDSVLCIRAKMLDNLPFEISQQQKDVIAELLPQLPPLHGRMLESDISEFVQAFERLAPDLPWTPGIVNEHSRNKQKERREKFTKEYLADLKRAVADSQLIAVDGNRIRCTTLSVGTFIPQKAAINYLESNGHTVELNVLNNRFNATIVDKTSNAELIDTKAIGDSDRCTDDQSKSDFSPPATTPRQPITDNQSKSPSISEENGQIDRGIGAETLIQNAAENWPDSAHKSSPPTATASTSTEAEAEPDKFIALDEVMALIGAKKTTVYGMMNESSAIFDPTFPKNLPKRPGSSASRWSLDEIIAWQDRQKNQRK